MTRLIERLFNWARNGGFWTRFTMAVLLVMAALTAVVTATILLGLFIKIFGWWSLILLPVLGIGTVAGFNKGVFGESDADIEARKLRRY